MQRILASYLGEKITEELKAAYLELVVSGQRTHTCTIEKYTRFERKRIGE